MVEVPVSTEYHADNRSDAYASGSSDNKVRNVVTSDGGTYDVGAYTVDNSVAPVSVTLSPTIVKGNSAQKASSSATQSGDTPLMTLIKVALPVVGVLVAYYLTKDKEVLRNGYYY